MYHNLKRNKLLFLLKQKTMAKNRFIFFQCLSFILYLNTSLLWGANNEDREASIALVLHQLVAPHFWMIKESI